LEVPRLALFIGLPDVLPIELRSTGRLVIVNDNNLSGPGTEFVELDRPRASEDHLVAEGSLNGPVLAERQRAIVVAQRLSVRVLGCLDSGLVNPAPPVFPPGSSDPNSEAALGLVVVHPELIRIEGRISRDPPRRHLHRFHLCPRRL
jgi:hypothetical protein